VTIGADRLDVLMINTYAGIGGAAGVADDLAVESGELQAGGMSGHGPDSSPKAPYAGDSGSRP
jgi:hypothetical protein